MVHELIKLTESEQYLQDANFTMTLKDVADTYNKKHFHMVRDFNVMISKLNEENLNASKFGWVDYIDEKGETRQTVEMDLKTLVWFIAKFDENIRMQVVNFAFSKYQEEQEQKLIEVKEMANKVRIHDDGTTSITGLIQHYGFTESYQEIKNALTWKGVMDVDIKITTRPTMNDDYQDIVYKHKTFEKNNSTKTKDYAYKHDSVRAIVDQYKKAGSPDVNSDFKDRMRAQLEEYLSDK